MTTLRALRTDEAVTVVTVSGDLVGRYVLNDEFKPYIHPLNTPSGRTVSLAITHDHKHHKGLMYALRTTHINFWEETPTLPGERVGRQVQRALRLDKDEGETVAFEQSLTWQSSDGTRKVFEEVRHISCTATPDSYLWHWRATLTAQTELTLIQSQYSSRAVPGRKINYHGLGIRFPRCFGGMDSSSAFFADKVLIGADEAMGATPKEAMIVGAFDGEWPPRSASVQLRQKGDHSLFAMRDPFAYMAFGPSNEHPVFLKPGDVIEEDFEIEVSDAGERA